jgi:hypothetical protein
VVAMPGLVPGFALFAATKAIAILMPLIPA